MAASSCVLIACLDSSDRQGDASVLFSIPVQTVRLPAVADTDVAAARPNSNFGYEPTLGVKRHQRALLRFDETAVANAIGSGRLISAAIELEIDADSHDLTAEHPLDLHRLTLSWTEEGATWNCADDENTGGPSSDCAFDDRWKMGGRGPNPWESQPSVSLVVPKNPPGPVVFDVTSDVAALLSGAPNHGWIINRARGSHRSARASLVSAEAGDGPQLVLSFESNEVPPDPPEVAELASVFPDADTTIKRARPNKNFGDEPALAVRGGIFRRRALVRVDPAAVSAALDGQPLLRAELEFSVADSRFWRRGTLALHRLTQRFTESGATWNCANDTNTGNHRQDCDPADEWEMGFFGENPWDRVATDVALVPDDATEPVVFDVTADVTALLAGGANSGWILKVPREFFSKSRTIEFGSRESLASPRLILSVPACVPESDAELCSRLGAECDAASGTDNCGDPRTVDCGSCLAPETCGGAGTPNVCGCTPTTCTAVGADCGTISDGCFGALDCGTCAFPETCGGAGTPNVCGCTPTTCADAGANCGSIDDGCGTALLCGQCAGPETCGGGGQDNFCGCTPRTCADAGVVCGTVTDGCGTVLACGACQPPILEPVGDQIVALGSTLDLQLIASDPDGDPLSFTVAPLPLLANATFDPASGGFSFRPDGDQVGVFSLTFGASDGFFTDTETVSITVSAPAPGTPTSMTGQLLDANDFALGTITPIVNATISILGSGVSTTTDVTGVFVLSAIPSGEQVFDIDASSAIPADDGSVYGSFRESTEIIDGALNEVARPFFLPRIDADSITVIDPNATTVVVNPNLGVSLTIPPHTAKNPDGTDYAGVLSISLVPFGLTPATLPENLAPGLVVTLQPITVTFAAPVPITFPNFNVLATDNELELWSLDRSIGGFAMVGTAEVSADGERLETIDGGITESSWHFVLPPRLGVGTDIGTEDDQAFCALPGSVVSAATGDLRIDYRLPAIVSRGRTQAPRLLYTSRRADPRPIISIETTILERAAVPHSVSAVLDLGGAEIFTNTSTLREDQDETIVQTIQFAANFPTNAYPFELVVTSKYPQIAPMPPDARPTEVRTTIEGTLIVENFRGSPFGAGWALEGLSRLHRYFDKDGRPAGVLAVDGAIAQKFELPEPIEELGGITVVDAKWVLVATRDLVAAQAAHFNPRDGLLYAASRTFFNTGGSINRIEADGTVTLLSPMQIPNSVGIDPDDGDIFTSDTDTGIYRTGFGETGRDLWSSNFRPAQGLEIAGDAYGGAIVAPGDGLVTAAGFVLGAAPGVWTFSPDVPGAPTPLSNGGLFGSPRDVAVGTGEIYVADAIAGIIRLEPGGGQSQVATSPPLDQPIGVAIIPETQDLLVLEFGKARVVQVNPATGSVSALFRGFSLQAAGSAGIDISADGTQIAVSDSATDTIYVFRRSGFFSQDGDFSTLEENLDGTFIRAFPNGTEVHFDDAGLQQQVIDANRNTTTWTYAGDRPILITDPVGRETQLIYAGGRLASIIDAADRTTLFEHDGSDLVRITAPDGTEQKFTYDVRHRMTSRLNERRFADTYTYDVFGRYAQTRHADGSVRMLTPATTRGLLDPASGLGTESNPGPIIRPSEIEATAIDGEGRPSRFAIGPLGAAESVIDAADLETIAERNDDANVTSIQMPSGHSMLFAYDASGNRAVQADQTVGGTIRWVYEQPLNLLRSFTNALGQIRSFEYDDRGNQTGSTSAVGRSNSFEYDARGNVVSSMDRIGTPAVITYDAAQNVIETTIGSPPNDRVEAIQRNVDGSIAQVVDPLSRVTDLEYDSEGRLISRTLADGRLIEVGYDKRGNLTSVVPPGRSAHSFAYSPTDELASYTAPDVGLPNHQTAFEFNQAQQLVRVSHPDGRNVSLVYDSAGRIAMVTSPRDSTTFDYSTVTGQLATLTNGDAQLTIGHRGELTTMVAVSGAVAGAIIADYDQRSLLTSIEVVGAPAVTYDYDADGVVTGAGDLTITRSPQTAITLGTQLGGVSEDLGYNEFGEPTSYSAAYDGSRLFAESLVVDKLGRVIERIETIAGSSRTFSYRYDLAGRLEEVSENGVPVEVYVYDDNGNRVDEFGSSGFVTSTVDQQDRLTSRGSTTFTYTANGDLLTKSDAGVTTFDYDTLGNLRAVVLNDGTTVEYVIDGFNRRIGKRVDGSLVQGLLYLDGLNPIAELDGAGQIVSLFVYGSRPNVPDYMIRDGVTYRILADLLGSPRLVVDASNGTVIARMDYDGLGRVVVDSNPGFQPFGFAGGLLDQHTGLTRFGARDYDASVGRWTTKDINLFTGGATNAYAYVDNDPINRADWNGQLIGCSTTADCGCLRRPSLCAFVLAADYAAVGAAGGFTAAAMRQQGSARASSAARANCLNAGATGLGTGVGVIATDAAIRAQEIGLQSAILTGAAVLAPPLLAQSSENMWRDFFDLWIRYRVPRTIRNLPPFEGCVSRFIRCMAIRDPFPGDLSARLEFCWEEFLDCVKTGGVRFRLH